MSDQERDELLKNVRCLLALMRGLASRTGVFFAAALLALAVVIGMLFWTNYELQERLAVVSAVLDSHVHGDAHRHDAPP